MRALAQLPEAKPRSTLALPTALLTLLLLLWSGGVAGALSEVWIGHSASEVSRYDYSGTLLGTFALGGGSYPTDSMALVGSEVWFGGSNTILRYDTSGNLLGTFTDGAHTATAMTAVPEPSTTLVFTLGFMGMSSFNRRRRVSR